MKKIFEAVRMNNLTVKNRLVRSATWEGIANPDGGITDVAYEIYEELARGGIGAIITGFTSVADHDFYFDGMMRLSRDELIPQYKKLVEIIHREDCPVIAQLALGAYYRKRNDGKFVQVEPDDMRIEEIQEVVAEFVQAAVRADKAGYDGVQIHAAHFFFLSRFISPRVNHRQDAYGGSTAGRMRILLDIMQGIRQEAPRLHITIKINCNDFTPGGMEEEESLTICKRLADEGIDSIEVSGNGTSVAGIFYSNPFYYNIGDTLNAAGMDFIYAQTNDAFGQIETYNVRTGQREIIGSWNEDFAYTDEDIEGYLDFAEQAGYKHIILAGHSLGANKVIYYLSRHHDARVEHFVFLSPANIGYLTSDVTEQEKQIIRQQVERGEGNKMLPFPLLGWINCIASTAYQWVFANILDNVHVEKDRDFSAVEKIAHTGALVIGTYDNFTYGDPAGFLKNINEHIPTAQKNKLIFLERTGHTYQQKEQELADKLCSLIRDWGITSNREGSCI